MKATVLSARKYSTRLKVTIQSTGRLGFTDETAKRFKFGESTRYIKFVKDEDTGDLYLILCEEDDDAFVVRKSGQYFYLQTTMLFDELGYRYKEQTIMFDLSRSDEYDADLGGECYRMVKRITSKKPDVSNTENDE